MEMSSLHVILDPARAQRAEGVGDPFRNAHGASAAPNSSRASWIARASVVTAVCLALGGCMSEDLLRYDGVTTSAGDAIAANSAMQMVDPWPRGVEDVRLATPAERPVQAEPSSEDAGAADASKVAP